MGPRRDSINGVNFGSVVGSHRCLMGSGRSDRGAVVRSRESIVRNLVFEGVDWGIFAGRRARIRAFSRNRLRGTIQLSKPLLLKFDLPLDFLEHAARLIALGAPLLAARLGRLRRLGLQAVNLLLRGRRHIFAGRVGTPAIINHRDDVLALSLATLLPLTAAILLIARFNHPLLLAIALSLSRPSDAVTLSTFALVLGATLLLVKALALLAGTALVLLGNFVSLATAARLLLLPTTALLLLAVLARLAMSLRFLFVAQALLAHTGLLLAELVQFALFVGVGEDRGAGCNDGCGRDGGCGDFGDAPAVRGGTSVAIVMVALLLAAVATPVIGLVVISTAVASVVPPVGASVPAIRRHS
jgi:hypothetical protein